MNRSNFSRSAIPGKLSYRVQHNTHTRINGSILADTSNTYLVDVLSLTPTNDEMRFCIQQSSFGGAVDILDTATDFISLITSPKDCIELRLTKHGVPEALLNKPEMVRKWEKVKEKLQTDKTFLTFDQKTKHELVMLGDDEFLGHYDLLKDIKSSPLVREFFIPVYNIEWQKRSETAQSALHESILFKGLRFHLNLNQGISYIADNGQESVVIETRSRQPLTYDKKAIDKKKQEYYPFLTETCESFQLRYENLVQLNCHTGAIERIDALLTEGLNECLSTLIEIKFNLIKNEV